MPKRTEGRRIAFLTDRERSHLKSKEINRKILSKMHKKLDRRLPALVDDLEIIRDSPHLEIWREINATDLNSVLERLESTSFGTRFVYKYPIRRYKKDNEWVYWLDKSNPITRKVPEVFDSTHALRKLRNLTSEDKAKLITAYERGLIPEKKENAISLEEITKRLNNKNKNKNVKNMKKVLELLKNGKRNTAIFYRNPHEN